MADREQITQPTLGSNEVGTETNDTHLRSGISTGTDTQLHLAAKSGNKNSGKNNNAADKIKEKNKEEFLELNDTDE
jgi:hypothetical protein